MIKLWDKIAQDERIIKIMACCCGVQGGIIILLILTAMLRVNDITIHIPPNLDSGATISSNEVPTANVYAFAYYVMQVLQHWPNDGSKDCQQNINNYGSYLSPKFKQQLLRQYQQRLEHGELNRRVQVVYGVEGAAFDANNSTRLDRHSWQINLTLRQTQYSNGRVVHDATILFPLKVMQFDVDRNANPWGLVLAGFISPPKRIKTYV